MGKGTTRRQLLSLAFGRSARAVEEPTVRPLEPAPEGASPRRIARIDSPRCVALSSFCSTCSERCPVEGAVVLFRNQPRIDPEVCDGCGVCADLCPAPLKAISMLELPPEEESA